MLKSNQNITIDYNKGWSTHMPVLIRLFSLTEGPIMEVGSGVYSTPLLHWLCHPTRRPLMTYESDKDFIKLAKQYQSRTHLIRHIDDYRHIDTSQYYSIIFIDHNGHHRGETAVHLKDCADYIILHDTNVIRRNSYQLLPDAFKYYRDYTANRPWTGVASNVKPVDALW
jgi:hypothetical protein